MERASVRWIALGLLLAVMVGQPAVVFGQADTEGAVGEPVVTQGDDSEDMPVLDEEGSGIEIPDVADAGEFEEWLLQLDQQERDALFMQIDAGPKPKGLYIGFMLSDRPNYEDFDISFTDKTVMTFVFDRWIGKVFDGKGNLRNVLTDEKGFKPSDLAGKIFKAEGYIDEDDSWIAEYPEESAYGFIIDEFRQIKPGFLFGRTYLVPPKKGDKTFFECGLVRVAKHVPKTAKANQILMEAAAEAESESEAEAAPVARKDEEEVESEVEAEEEVESEKPAKKKKAKKSKDEEESASEGDSEEEEVEAEEPAVRAQDDGDSMPDIDEELADEAPAPEADGDSDGDSDKDSDED